MARAEKFYTTEEVTRYFSISRYAIHRAIKSGSLKVSKKEGRNNMFSEKDIESYITSNM